MSDSGYRSVQSWGRLPFPAGVVSELRDREKVSTVIAQAEKPGSIFGNGRSYGDVCLGPGTIWRTLGLDHFLGFDRTTGILHCEAGVTLQQINRLALASGWFLPVTPGTQFATLGGAVANDVHGKNHHRRGTIGCHVLRLNLVRTDGTHHTCSPATDAGLFSATIGGLGLTGIITDIEIQLIPAHGEWMDVETIAFDQLDDFFALSDSSEADWEYTVSWIDCLANGRGIFSRGNHAVRNDNPGTVKRPLQIPITPPVSLINGFSLRLFNPFYFHWNKQRSGHRIQHYQPFFYPLDNILAWNRLYGPKGFYQYQSVVPPRDARAATAAMLGAIADSGMGSPLAVLKTFGKVQSPGVLSFPMEGVTLALDFPNAGNRTLRLFERLDAIVREAGGRIYPAKDARMPRDVFLAGYPRLDEFLPWRDPGIETAMASRLLPC